MILQSDMCSLPIKNNKIPKYTVNLDMPRRMIYGSQYRLFWMKQTPSILITY